MIITVYCWHGKTSNNITTEKGSRHSHKTVKRLAIKQEMLAAKASKGKRNKLTKPLKGILPLSGFDCHSSMY